MAGSEQEGVDGADAELFEGATWVLTPTVDTHPSAYALVQSVVRSLGADVVALSPQRHSELVTTASHVPHPPAAARPAPAAATAADDARKALVAQGFPPSLRKLS